MPQILGLSPYRTAASPKTAAKVRRNPNTDKWFYTFLHFRPFLAHFQEHLLKRRTRSHKIGVTQTDPTGMSHTATTGVTHTDSKAQGAYILTNLKQPFKTESSMVLPTISHPPRTSTHIYPKQSLVSFVKATTDRVPRWCLRIEGRHSWYTLM